jgi:hypothetical protein
VRKLDGSALIYIERYPFATLDHCYHWLSRCVADTQLVENIRVATRQVSDYKVIIYQVLYYLVRNHTRLRDTVGSHDLVAKIRHNGFYDVFQHLVGSTPCLGTLTAYRGYSETYLLLFFLGHESS